MGKGVEGRETLVPIFYCMREESNFKKKRGREGEREPQTRDGMG